MSEIGMDTIPLRERAQKWLDNYKAGNTCEVLSLENTATIVAVFLNVTDPSKYTECEEGTDLIEAQNEAEVLRKKNEELGNHIHMVEREMDRMGGQIAAYEFVIRCNGVSGAEVRP